MPVLNNVIKSLTFLCLSERHKATLDKLHVINQNFLSIKQLQLTNFQIILTKMISPCALITFDTKYSKLIDLYSGQSRFKHLAEFAKFLFPVPHSNSYYESIFTTIRKICTQEKMLLKVMYLLVYVYTRKQHLYETIFLVF